MGKKLMHILLTGVMLATILTGCGTAQAPSAPVSNGAAEESDDASTQEASAQAEEASEGEVNIRFAWWGDTSRNDKYNEICDRFEASYPGIKVTREPSSWGDYWDKLATQSAGGNAPDVMGMHVQFTADYASRGVLADLQPFINDGTIDFSDWEDTVVETGKYDGVMCMVPMGVTFTNMIVNSSLLEQYGVHVPAIDEDYTWDDLMADGEKLKDASNGEAYIISDPSTTYTFFRYWAREYAEDLYTEDGKLAFDEETVASWFSFWKEARDKGIIPDAATSTEDGTNPLEQKLFTKGECAYIVTPANQLWMFAEQMPDSKLVLARNPVVSEEQRGEYIEGAAWSVSAAASPEKQAAAAKFINFFENSEESYEIFKLDQGVPGNTKMGEYIKTMLTEPEQQTIDYVTATMPVASPATYAPAGASEVQTAFEDAAGAVQFEEATPEEAAKQFIEAAKAAIGE